MFTFSSLYRSSQKQKIITTEVNVTNDNCKSYFPVFVRFIKKEKNPCPEMNSSAKILTTEYTIITMHSPVEATFLLLSDFHLPL